MVDVGKLERLHRAKSGRGMCVGIPRVVAPGPENVMVPAPKKKPGVPGGRKALPVAMSHIAMLPLMWNALDGDPR